jgi:hypothetical protein
MKYLIGGIITIGLCVTLLFKSWFAYDPTLNMSVNNAPGRSISTTGSNNTFTISTKKCAYVVYVINFSAALTLATSNGKVTLDYSTDAGSNWFTISSVSQVFGTSVTINTNQDLVLSGMVPPNALIRINRTSNVSVTITAGAQQECTM